MVRKLIFRDPKINYWYFILRDQYRTYSFTFIYRIKV